MQATVVAGKVVKASELGCALDVDLDSGASTKGAGAATDDTAILNKFLATAFASNPIALQMDGAALITGLQISRAGYTTIQGSGDATGFFLKTGSNNDAIHNRPAGYVIDPGPPAPARIGQQIALKNFRVNGNRGDGHNGNSTTGDPHGGGGFPWFIGLNLMDVEQVTIDQVTVLHASTYSMRLSNVGHATISRCRLAPFGPNEKVVGNNTDGIHVNGPSNDIQISGCYFRTGDDAIALNAPEGHGGSIERVTATDCVFDGVQLMMRMYSGSRGAVLVDGVQVSGFSGTANVSCFLFGLEDRPFILTQKDAVRNVVIHNCQVSGPYLAFMQDNMQDVTFSDVIWTPTSAPYGMVATANHDLTIRSLTLMKCTVLQTAQGHGAVCVVDLRGLYAGELATTLEKLTIDGVTCTDAEGTKQGSLDALVMLSKGSQVNSIVLATVDARKIKRLVPEAQWGQVDQVSGAGVLASGWAIPDGKMAEKTAYVSEETLMPAMKRDDIAHTLASVVGNRLV